MTNDEIVRALREMLPPKVDYAELVCAEGFAHGQCYVWDDPEPYIISAAADLIESLQAQLADYHHMSELVDGKMKENQRLRRINENLQEQLAASREKADFVRCKYCEYWQDNNGGYPHEECRWDRDESPNDDDYCSYGAKMEGGTP